MSAVTPDLSCPICYDVMRNAVETDCGHAFCEPCAREMIRSFGRSCPVCRCQVRLHHPSYTLRALVAAKVAGLCPGADPGPDVWFAGALDSKWPHRFEFPAARSRRDGQRFPSICPEDMDVRVSAQELEVYMSGVNDILAALIPKPARWRAMYTLGALALCAGPIALQGRHDEAHSRVSAYLAKINRETFLVRGVAWKLVAPERKTRFAYFPAGWRVEIECAAPTGSLTQQVKHLASVVAAQQLQLQKLQRQLASHEKLDLETYFDETMFVMRARRTPNRLRGRMLPSLPSSPLSAYSRSGASDTVLVDASYPPSSPSLTDSVATSRRASFESDAFSPPPPLQLPGDVAVSPAFARAGLLRSTDRSTPTVFVRFLYSTNPAGSVAGTPVTPMRAHAAFRPYAMAHAASPVSPQSVLAQVRRGVASAAADDADAINDRPIPRCVGSTTSSGPSDDDDDDDDDDDGDDVDVSDASDEGADKEADELSVYRTPRSALSSACDAAASPLHTSSVSAGA